MGRKLPKRFALNELMVMLCVLIMLASVAIPSYMHLQKQARVDQLMASAKTFKNELSGWITYREHTTDPESSWEQMKDPVRDRSQMPDIRSALEDCTRSHNHRNPNPVSQGPLVSVETQNTSLESCPRDGKIHVIPLVTNEDTVYGAVVAVTNLAHQGGPKDDGLLATFQVLPDREGRMQTTAEGR